MLKEKTTFQIENKAFQVLTDFTIRVFEITETGTEYKNTVSPGSCQWSKIVADAKENSFNLF